MSSQRYTAPVRRGFAHIIRALEIECEIESDGAASVNKEDLDSIASGLGLKSNESKDLLFALVYIFEQSNSEVRRATIASTQMKESVPPPEETPSTEAGESPAEAGDPA